MMYYVDKRHFKRIDDMFPEHDVKDLSIEKDERGVVYYKSLSNVVGVCTYHVWSNEKHRYVIDTKKYCTHIGMTDLYVTLWYLKFGQFLPDRIEQI